jgi:hypothetical protein
MPYPNGTVPVFAPVPGNKLPGYDHSVPPGQIAQVPSSYGVLNYGGQVGTTIRRARRYF